MAMQSKLEEIARSRGTTVRELMDEAIANRKSIRGAADYIGVSMPSIQWWLARNNLRVETVTSARLVIAPQPEMELAHE